MINLEFRNYNYFSYGGKDAYGQQTLSTEPIGAVRMAIYTTSQTINGNINYKDATYLGLAYELLDDTTVIDYEGKKLKVLYATPQGRLKQIFLAEL